MLRDYIERHTNPPVFLVSAVLILAFVIWGAFAPGHLNGIADALNGWITSRFGWWYTIAVTGFLVFTIVLMFSPLGRIVIGKPGEKPEWSTLAWFSMLFTAGMGIGLVFFGVAEPISHLIEPPIGDPGTPAAARDAMNLTFFHWGLHPWAIYIVVGLSMGYFCFRHDLPLRPASAFYPLIGDRIYGWIGNLIDILAVFGTLFGLATSLGLGATQINAGLAEVFGLPNNATWQVIIIAAVTAVAVISVMLGLNYGIRRLSVFNMWIATLLALVVFVVGPTLFILEFMVSSTGYYLQNLPETSMRLFSFSGEGEKWISDWTLFYWGWWISWSPFVGMFIARISRGRTIRQFILGCLLAPTGAAIAWFTIFGGSAIHFILGAGGNNPLAEASTENALFILLNQLPIAEFLITLLSLLAVLVVAIFFATSSDSGSMVVDMLTNGGDPHPIRQHRLFWAVLEGVVAAILLVAGAAAGGGDNALKALQTASICAGLPFSVVLALMCWGLSRQLMRDRIPSHPQIAPARERFRGKQETAAKRTPGE